MSALMAAAISGCTMVPPYERPVMEMPGAWSGIVSGDARPAEANWWTSFDNPTLDHLIEDSLRGSLTLRAAVAKIDEARGAALVAGAPTLPSIGISGSIDRSDDTSTSRTQDLFAQASYELDFWGKNRAAADAGKALANASIYDAQTAAMSLTASAADTYFSILSLNDRIKLAQQIANDARRVLGLIQAQHDHGMATELQVQQQVNAVAGFDAAVPLLRQQMEQALHQLSILVGHAPERFDTLPRPTLDGITPPAIAPVMPATLLTRRPDIEAAEERLKAANFNVGAARAAFFPSLTLSAQGGITSGSLSHFFPAHSLTDIAANLAQPLFEGGQLSGQLKTNKAQAIELAATYGQTVLTAFGDVEDALSAVNQQAELEAADRVAVDSARRAAYLAEAQYRLGAADYLTVLTTERTLYQAEDSLLQTHLLRLQAVVALCRTMGGDVMSAASLPQTTFSKEPSP
jgi:NodT family efflux transporter outer membrane factor (OMF) lipoprotein